jgi:CheY-like chemotaxis protein
MKILVAEDEKNIGESYKSALEDYGHEVTLTHDGVECIETYRKQGKFPHGPPFDVVILEIQFMEQKMKQR